MAWGKAAATVSVACGALAGCLYLAAGFGTVGALVLVYMTELPLFVAGLWFGTGAAATAGLSGAVVLLAASDLLGAALFAAMNAAPVALLVRQALLARRRGDGTLVWYPPGLLTAWLTALALGGIAAALALYGGPDGLQTALRRLVSAVLDDVALPAGADRNLVVETIAAIIPGVVAASWMVTTIVNGALAQGALARFQANWRPSPDLATLGLPLWIPAALGLAGVAATFGGAPRYLGVNAAIALIVPFCLAGLAVVHAAARRLTPHPAMGLVCFYAVAVLFGWPFLLVAVLGLLESWLGLRRRLIPLES